MTSKPSDKNRIGSITNSLPVTAAGMIISVIVICVSVLYSVSKLGIPIILADEFGNIANTFYFSGVNWSEIVQHIGYYGFGSTLFYLIPVIFAKDSTMLYQSIIVLNCILLVITYFMLILISKRMTGGRITLLGVLASAMIVCYPSYIVYANTIMYETAILLTSVFAFLCFIKLYETGRKRWTVLFAASLGYMLMLHMRLIAIIAGGCIAVLYLFIIKKLDLKKFLLFSGVLLAGGLAFYFLKDTVQTNLWLSGETVGTINTTGGQLKKVSFLLSVQGIKNFLKIVIGQVFYLGSSTYLIGFVPIYCFIKSIVISIRKKQKPDLFSLVNAFAVITYIFQICIVAIFFISLQRLDHMIYGRYTEYIYAMLMICGIAQLAKKLVNLIECGGILAVYTVLYFLVSYFLKAYTFASSPTCISVVSVWKHLDYYSNNFSGQAFKAMPVFLTAAVVFAAISVLFRIKLPLAGHIAVTASAVMFIMNGTEFVSVYSADVAATHFAQKRLADKIAALDSDEIVYVMEEDNININSMSKVELLQFALMEQKINIVDIDAFDYTENYIITPGVDPFTYGLADTYNIIYAESSMYLWEKKASGELSYEMPGSGFYSTNRGETDYTDGSIASDGSTGYITYGPYCSMESGVYEITVDISLADTKRDDLGYFEVVGDGVQEAVVNLSAEDFADGADEIITVEVEFEESVSSVQLRTLIYDSVYLNVDSITVTKLSE